jgi:hypothetical protein
VLFRSGDFIVVARGEQFRVQAAYASRPEVKRIVGQLRGARKADSASVGQRVISATRRLVSRLPAVAGLTRQAT